MWWWSFEAIKEIHDKRFNCLTNSFLTIISLFKLIKVLTFFHKLNHKSVILIKFSERYVVLITKLYQFLNCITLLILDFNNIFNKLVIFFPVYFRLNRIGLYLLVLIDRFNLASFIALLYFQRDFLYYFHYFYLCWFFFY